MEKMQTFWTLLDKYNIEIPIIQRDYAQGRAGNEKAEKVREIFLSVIVEKLDRSESLHLDFIYGCMQGNNLILLDGQQRLTTLFLLHWYTAVKERKHNSDIEKKLKKFKYQTRPSSERFCSNLAKFYPDLSASTQSIEKLIKDQPWFFIAWENDPTIAAMLNMLKNIEVYLGKDKTDYFNLLTVGKKINFHFLDLDKFKLSDDLYIKMNARGKPLTDFENFKAGYEKCLSENAEKKEYFAQKADRDWTELFWKEAAGKHDEAFMNYIDYITEVGFYLSSEETMPKNDNKLKYDILTHGEYRDLLFNSLDAWHKIEDKTKYFERYLSKNEYEQGKVCLFEDDVSLFLRCIKKEKFDNREKLLLYGFILQIQNNKEQTRELRLLRNLLINSRNELRSQNLHAMYTIVKNIFNYGFDNVISSNLTPFNGHQIEDEKAKTKFISEHPECTEDVYMLEDNKLLQGRLSAFIFDEETLSQHRKSFYKLFLAAYNDTEDNSCTTWIDIHRALLCLCKEDDDYAEPVNNNDRWKFGNNRFNWQELLTSGNTSRLKLPLNALLTALSEKSLDDIINKTLDVYKSKDKDWKYYFIRYKTMNIGASGIFVWGDEYSDLRMLNTTRLSGYWRDPYLWTIYEGLKGEKNIDPPWNIGYERNPLKIKHLKISNAPKGERGWMIKFSHTAENNPENHDKLRQKYSIDSEGLLSIKPSDDRIEIILQVLDEISD